MSTSIPADRPSGAIGSLSQAGWWGTAVLTASLFALVFWRPIVSLVGEWWSNPEAGHGLLVAPVAIWLAWRRGLVDARPAHVLGILGLLAAVVLRAVADLAAETFTMHVSVIGAAVALIVYHRGLGQLRAWWLPVTLLALAVPLPEVLLGSVALPLQFQASALGATLLDMRHVPVELAGNVIRLPDRELFVAEACSGLRSITALLSLAILLGGTSLRSVAGRLLLLAAVLPVAVFVNGARIFATGFAVHYFGPEFGTGVLHATEGWLMFVGALAVLGTLAAGAHALESLVARRREHA